MTFDISPEYFNIISRRQKQGYIYFVMMLVAFLAYSAYCIYKNLEIIPIGCVVIVVVEFLVLALVYYYANIEPIKGVPNTISVVEILQDRLVFRTSEFKIPFYRSEEKSVVIFLRDIVIREDYYPVKLVYDLDKTVWKIIYEKEELYLILDFFDKNLYSELAKLF